MDKITILDIIHHRNKYDTQIFYVIDRMPNFIYERDGVWLTGEDSGFFSFYRYEKNLAGGSKAFAGSKFNIPLKTGEILTAHGQWWNGIKPDYRELLVSISIGTPERLDGCNVFAGGIWIDPHVLQQTKNMNPSNNYYKYNSNHKDFGKHKIQSRWA